MTTQRIPHTYSDPQRGIEYVMLRPAEFSEAWKRAFTRMESGEDEVSDAEEEMYAGLAETRAINNADSPDDCE